MITSELDVTKPYIFELPDVLTAAECHRWIDRIQSLGTEAATINSARGAEVDTSLVETHSRHTHLLPRQSSEQT